MPPAINGLRTIQARSRDGAIATDISLPEVMAALEAGTIVIVKDAFEAANLRSLRAAILAWRAPATSHDRSDLAQSSRSRGEDEPESKIPHIFDGYLFAVGRDGDGIGRRARSTFERLAEYWRLLTGKTQTFEPDADGQALRARALHYPAGGGYFDWHAHPREPHRIGVILGLSELGVDFSSGGTEFETPSGVVSTLASHDIGDICLFRYDLRHRVTPVDPQRERRWDGAGRWTFIIPLQ